MKMTMLAAQERPNEYDSKKGHVKERILVLLDTEKVEDMEVSQTLTYVLRKEEEALIPVDGLRMKPVSIAVNEIREWGGGMRIGGRLMKETMAPFLPRTNGATK